MDTEKKSAVDKGYKVNIFCFKPQETIDFMNNLEEPWIAFKILARTSYHYGLTGREFTKKRN